MAFVSSLEVERWESSLQSLLLKLVEKYEKYIDFLLNVILYCRNRVDQEMAAEGLALEIQRLSSLLSSESFNRLIHDLNRRLFEMIHSSDTHEKISAMIAIGTIWMHVTSL